MAYGGGRLIFISSNSFTHLPLKDVLDMVTSHFMGFEISAEGTLRLPDIERELIEFMETHEIALQAHAPYSDINIASGNPRIRKAVMQELFSAMESASNIGIEVITLHPGFKTPLYRDFEKVRNRTRESLKIIEKKAKDLGIALALENMPPTFITIGRGPEEMEEMTQGLDVDWCFDVGHANITGTMEKFLEYSHRFTNIHIHDNNGTSDEHLPLGYGNIEWKRIIPSLQKYRGNLVLEMDRGIEDALKSMEYLKNLGIEV